MDLASIPHKLLPFLHSGSHPDLPAYVRIQEALLYMITAGHWKPGDRLPSGSQLASHFGVSLGTLRESLKRLVDDGVLVRRQGSGTFVASTRLLESQVRYYRFAAAPRGPIVNVSIKLVGAGLTGPGEWQEFLGADPAGYVMLRRLIRLDEVVPIYSESYLPASRFARLLDLSPGSLDGVTLYSVLERQFGTPTLKNEHFFSTCCLPGAALEVLEQRGPITGCRWEFLALSYRDTAIEYRRSYLQEMPLRLRLGFTTF